MIAMSWPHPIARIPVAPHVGTTTATVVGMNTGIQDAKAALQINWLINTAIKAAPVAARTRLAAVEGASALPVKLDTQGGAS
jgi:hypothetical protein